MNSLLKMSNVIFPLITYPYISRVLQPAGIGKISFASSVVSYFTMFAQLGIPTYGIRACAEVRDNKTELSRTVQELLIINLITSAIAYVALFFTVISIPRLWQEKYLYIIYSSAILLNTIGMEWLYSALEQYSYITIRSVIFKFVALLAMFLLVHAESDYVIYGAISILAASASNVFNFFYSRKFITLRPIGQYHFRRHLKSVGIFFAMSCATTIYTQMDTTMLGFLTDDAEVGLYNTAVKIKVVLTNVVTSLGTVLLPRASYYIARNRIEDFKRTTYKAINFIFDLALPIMLYFILYSRETIILISGPSYTGSVRPMQIIMPTLVLIGLTNILGMEVLVPLKREQHVLYSEIFGAVVNVIVNWLLIPHLASSGAAIGTICAETAVLVYQYYVLRRQIAPAFRQIAYWKISTALVAASLVCLPVKLLQLNTFFALVLSAALFFGVYGLIIVLLRESLAYQLFQQLQHRLHKN